MTSVAAPPRAHSQSGEEGRLTNKARGPDWVRRQGNWGYLMVAASVLGLCLFQLAPLVWAMAESVQQFNPITHRSLGFVGGANFATIFHEQSFWQAFVNTLIYAVGTTLVELGLGLGIALLLDRAVLTTRFARTAVISALAVSEAVTSLLWFTLLDKDNGLVNAALGLLGLPTPGWLIGSPDALISVMLVTIWHDVGLAVLIYLAGLQALDDDLYNAASVDGASTFQQLIHITLPLLRRSTVLAMFMVTITAVRIFTPIVIMTQGGPQGSSQNLVFYAYFQGIENLDYGVGSAVTVCLVVLLAAITGAQGLLLRRGDES